MKFISLFAGIGGFDLGMEQAGHECVAQVEWDKNAAGVLKRRWPDVPLFCDVTKVNADDLPDAEFITFGFPCQDLSVAGKREGLQGKRSGLFYESTRLIRGLLARGSGLRFALAENVAGLLSADDGIALAKCIRELLDCGAGEVGWRILDSQYFGVAQRRRRVFIVSDFTGQSCDQVLAVTESLPRHPPPRRQTGQGSSSHAGGSPQASSWTEGDPNGADVVGTLDSECGGNKLTSQSAMSGHYVTQGADVYNATLTGDTSPTVTSATGISNASGPKVMSFKANQSAEAHGLGIQEEVSPTLEGGGGGNNKPAVIHPQGQQVMSWCGDTTPKAAEDVSVTLRSQQGGEGEGVAHEDKEPVAFTASDRSNKAAWEGEVHGSINCQVNSDSSNLQMGIRHNMIVRRLTPTECERLQGFPDHWTEEREELELIDNQWHATPITHPQADGPRYRQLGNAVTVNVAKWIGLRLQEQA